MTFTESATLRDQLKERDLSAQLLFDCSPVRDRHVLVTQQPPLSFCFVTSAHRCIRIRDSKSPSRFSQHSRSTRQPSALAA